MMEAIEFKTKIKNGTIQIPQKYKQKTGNTVKVIIISEQGTKTQPNLLNQFLETKKMKTILITGAAGFIGFHLSQKNSWITTSK